MSDQQLIPLLPIEELHRRQRRLNSKTPELWTLLDTVHDPEIPALSIWDLGVLQDIELGEEGVTVTITPTYSGCPAVHAISEDIVTALQGAGYADSRVESRLSPAWTTGWMSADARKKLNNYGIATSFGVDNKLACPLCQSEDVRIISEFGSTACKALCRCNNCHEIFDYFKNI